MKYQKINSGDVALTAANEALCRLFLDLVMRRVGKDDKSGLYNVRRRDMIDVIQLNPELNHFFNIHLDRYNRILPVTYCVPMKEVENFVDKEFNSNINFSDKSRNFLAYFLLAFSCDLVNIAYELLLYSDKKMMGPSSIVSAIRINLVGTLRESLLTNVRETVKNSKAASALKAASKDTADTNTTKDKDTKNTKNKNTSKIDDDGSNNDEDDKDDDKDDKDDNEDNKDDDNDDEDDKKPEPPQAAPAGKKKQK